MDGTTGGRCQAFYVQAYGPTSIWGGGSNRVLPEWRTQIVCHAAPPGRNNNELLQCLFLTVVD